MCAFGVSGFEIQAPERNQEEELLESLETNSIAFESQRVDVDINFRITADGISSLMLATMLGDLKIVRLILANPNLNLN